MSSTKVVKISQSPTFKRSLKKLHSNQKKTLDKAIKALVKEPNLGEPKKGDLVGVSVYKFNIDKQQVLLAYQYIKIKKEIILLTLGSHENFYRDLKRK